MFLRVVRCWNSECERKGEPDYVLKKALPLKLLDAQFQNAPVTGSNDGGIFPVSADAKVLLYVYHPHPVAILVIVAISLLSLLSRSTP
jgi:hypothetical protein